jgi:hypothetical protein
VGIELFELSLFGGDLGFVLCLHAHVDLVLIVAEKLPRKCRDFIRFWMLLIPERLPSERQETHQPGKGSERANFCRVPKSREEHDIGERQQPHRPAPAVADRCGLGNNQASTDERKNQADN